MRERYGIFPGGTLIKKNRAVGLFEWNTALIDVDVFEHVSTVNDTITNNFNFCFDRNNYY